MIIAKPIGGLGNQMFAYAAAYALAQRSRQQLLIDTSNFNDYKTWAYHLAALCVPQDLAQPTLSSRIVPGRLRRFFPSRRKDVVCYQEPHFHYDEAVTKFTSSVELNGYFQSWRYFDHSSEELRRLFQPAEPLSAVAQDYQRAISNEAQAISLHVRRGDYLRQGTLEVHGLLDQHYYRQAVALMLAQYDNARFFLFSDDPEWVEQELLPGLNATVVKGQKDRPWEDMQLMANCRHNIIANSSFSWWGAWLNQHQDKTVIAPRQWFSPQNLRINNLCDLHPPKWILL